MPTVPVPTCKNYGYPVSSALPCTSGCFIPNININPPYSNNPCSSSLNDSILYTAPNNCTGTENTTSYTYSTPDVSFLQSLGPEWSTGITNCNDNLCYSANAAGGVMKFNRTSFSGNPLECCLKDYVCHTNDINTCFSGAGRNGTCDPKYRDVAAATCSDQVASYCLGSDLDPSDRSWVDRWSSGVCPQAVQRNYYQNCALINTGITRESFNYTQNIMTQALDKYQKQGFVIGSLPGFVGYSAAQEAFYQICQTTPGVCPMSSICAQQTTNSVARNPSLLQWCGCHLPPSEYQKYVNQYQINVECTPTCNRSGVIPIADSVGTGTIKCQESYCLIDNLTISLTNSTTDNITISQICGACSGGQCSCTISDTSISVANSEIGGGINLNQACSSSTCLRANPIPGQTPATIEVACSSPPDYNPFAGQEAAQEAARKRAQRIKNLLIIGVLLLTIIIILVIVTYGAPKVTGK